MMPGKKIKNKLIYTQTLKKKRGKRGEKKEKFVRSKMVTNKKKRRYGSATSVKGRCYRSKNWKKRGEGLFRDHDGCREIGKNGAAAGPPAKEKKAKKSSQTGKQM